MKHHEEHKRFEFADVYPVISELTRTRLAWGISAEDMAKRIGVTKYTLWHMEAGRKPVRFKNFMKWIEVLGFDLALTPKDSCVPHRVQPIQTENAYDDRKQF